MSIPGRSHRLLVALESHRPHLRRTISRYGGGHHTDDVVQDVYVAACSSIHRFAERSSLRTWLTRIAINKTLNRLEAERSRQRREAVGPWWQNPSAACPEATASTTEALDRVRAGLDGVPPRWRFVYESRMMDGRSYAALSEDLGVAIGTVHRWNQLVADRLATAVRGEEAEVRQ